MGVIFSNDLLAQKKTYERVLGSGSSSSPFDETAVINLGRLRRFQEKLYTNLRPRFYSTGFDWNWVKITFPEYLTDLPESFAIRVTSFGSDGETIISNQSDMNGFSCYSSTFNPCVKEYAVDLQSTPVCVLLRVDLESEYIFENLWGVKFVCEHYEDDPNQQGLYIMPTTVPPIETTTNKTNIISSASTNTQYPSAAAVYNAISGITGLPSTSAQDNGKVLQVVDGQWRLVTPTVVYTGTDTPLSSIGNDGDIYLQTS